MMRPRRPGAVLAAAFVVLAFPSLAPAGSDAPAPSPGSLTGKAEMEALESEALAMHMLARAHVMGLGVALDEARSFELLAGAARAGYGPAQLDLGDYYREGIGVARDPAQAYFWYRVAAGNGVAQAEAAAARTGAGLTPERRASLDAAARVWRPPPPATSRR